MQTACRMLPGQCQSKVPVPPQELTRYADNVAAFGDSELLAVIPSGTGRFCSERELAGLAADWPSSRIVELWNSLPGVQAVKRFTDRKTGIARIWKAIQNLEPVVAKQARTAGSKPAGSSSKAGGLKGAAGRRNTRAGEVLELLQRPGGASLREIMAATGWQAHSVRVHQRPLAQEAGPAGQILQARWGADIRCPEAKKVRLSVA
jgi:hypothetical protein